MSWYIFDAGMSFERANGIRDQLKALWMKNGEVSKL